MNRERPEPRWPDGPLVSVTVGEGVIGLTHCATDDGNATTETIGALAGRPDVARLALRLKDLRPRTAIVALAVPPVREDFDSGVSFGAVLGLISALGIEVEWAAPPQPPRPEHAVLH